MPSRILNLIRRAPFTLLGRERMRRPNFILEYVRGKAVLDIGVVQHDVAAYEHPAWIHRHVAREAAACVGLDYLEEGVKFLQAKGYDVVQANAEDFDLGRTFDVVVAGEIIEHLNNVGAFLTMVRRHLRPGGRLVITTPNPWFIGHGWECLFSDPAENPEHTAWFSMGMLRELLRRHSFEVERALYGSGEDIPWLVPILPARLRHTSIWLVARRKPEGQE
jgi:2-polyprenyl-3-methyl-5-hydroxy-6-metoxy-1,4-benzoquinol methylase